LALYRVRRHGAAETTEGRLGYLMRTSRLADRRLREARSTHRAGPAHIAAAAGTAGSDVSPRQLERVAHVLHDGEAVVCIASALFRSATQQHTGSAVLTDRRLVCVDPRARGSAPLELPLMEITSITATASDESGAAKRGELVLVRGGLVTSVVRIDPWQRAQEIATYVEQWQAERPAGDGTRVIETFTLHD
jgi:hypothetical protein